MFRTLISESGLLEIESTTIIQNISRSGVCRDIVNAEYATCEITKLLKAISHMSHLRQNFFDYFVGTTAKSLSSAPVVSVQLVAATISITKNSTKSRHPLQSL